jgi:hypothetical protein
LNAGAEFVGALGAAIAAVAYGFRANVSSDILRGASPLTRLHSANQVVRWASDVRFLLAFLTLAVLTRFFKSAQRLLPPVSGDRHEERRRLNSVIKSHPDWAAYRQWIGFVVASFVLVGISLIFRPTHGDSLTEWHATDQRRMYLDIGSAVTLSISGWLCLRAVRGVESGVRRGASAPSST